VIVKQNPPTVEQINQAFLKAANGAMKGIIRYTDEPIVSVDIIGESSSCVFDSELTSVIGKMIKTVSWYDNEMGYSNRLVDLTLKFAKL
jgi:glyceraldehyde 3-phosphate dehydrogenase